MTDLLAQAREIAWSHETTRLPIDTHVSCAVDVISNDRPARCQRLRQGSSQSFTQRKMDQAQGSRATRDQSGAASTHPGTSQNRNAMLDDRVFVRLAEQAWRETSQ